MNMKINRFFLAAFAVAMSASCWADDVPALCIEQNDAVSTIEISEILSIKFVGDDMVVNMKDGTSCTFRQDNVMIVEFGRMASAINGLMKQQEIDSEYIFTDMQGRTVARGRVGNDSRIAMPEKKGVYILCVGKKNIKMLVK